MSVILCECGLMFGRSKKLNKTDKTSNGKEVIKCPKCNGRPSANEDTVKLLEIIGVPVTNFNIEPEAFTDSMFNLKQYSMIYKMVVESATKDYTIERVNNFSNVNGVFLFKISPIGVKSSPQEIASLVKEETFLDQIHGTIHNTAHLWIINDSIYVFGEDPARSLLAKLYGYHKKGIEAAIVKAYPLIFQNIITSVISGEYSPNKEFSMFGKYMVRDQDEFFTRFLRPLLREMRSRGFTKSEIDSVYCIAMGYTS